MAGLRVRLLCRVSAAGVWHSVPGFLARMNQPWAWGALALQDQGECNIAIGLAPDNSALDLCPGWAEASVGLHCDNGPPPPLVALDRVFTPRSHACRGVATPFAVWSIPYQVFEK